MVRPASVCRPNRLISWQDPFFKERRGVLMKLIAILAAALLIAAVDLLFPMVSRYAVQELLPHNSYLTLC